MRHAFNACGLRGHILPGAAGCAWNRCPGCGDSCYPVSLGCRGQMQYGGC